MNTAKLRSKRALVTGAAAIALLGAGGAVWATTASADVGGGDRDRAGAAAVEAVGGGTVLDVDSSDDAGEAYEVEVRKADGSEVDVALDKDYKVLTQQPDDADDRDTPDADGNDADDNDENDADDNDADDNDADENDAADRAVSDADRNSAEQAAIQAIGSGSTVTDVDAGDGGVAYEVDVRAADGAEWDVDLDTTFKVITKTADN